MKVTYKSANERLTFEFEVSTEKEAFEKVGNLQELFEEIACGCCGATEIRNDVREVDKHRYFHIVCKGCNARLDFGQSKDNETLFAKRREHPTTSGWYKYQGEQSQAQSQPPAQASAIPAAVYDPSQDSELRAIVAAKHRGTLDQISQRIKAEVDAGRITGIRRETLRKAYEAKLAEMSKGGAGRTA